ncbi:sigma-70 family RNA polymerase sigma factor [Ktedonosporobacter rubrisoli]|uniref:RNA polymerase sigma factor n=1 Tax=Ktedonosporobacter rubrisoli TaxID=2509675 RepID=A0A4P6JIU7_KTERU|nr:sigma-70 family RNA polymerase sigma factor [Ktedonosporobacter rubrisoli]QBD74923.1 sigma-70 family RNA polymerase sigma factor [Ktedonosporobacter rubrisoli]
MGIFRKKQQSGQRSYIAEAAIDHLSDEELMSAIAHGTIEAIEALYDRYHQLLYSLAYRMVADHQIAEDLLQETFLSVWQHAAIYSPGAGSVKTWLCSIIHHDTIDYLRKLRRRSTLGNVTLEAVEEESNANDTDVWDETWRKLQGVQVHKALMMLPKEQRLVIELAYFGGWTHTEIADGCQIPLGTVKARMRLGLQHLRHQLLTLGIDEF